MNIQKPGKADYYSIKWRGDSSNCFRSYGNENRGFNNQGLMVNRHASLSDLPISPQERLFHWPLGRRPDDLVPTGPVAH